MAMHFGCTCFQWKGFDKYVNTYSFTFCPFCGTNLEDSKDKFLHDAKCALTEELEKEILSEERLIQRIKVYRMSEWTESQPTSSISLAFAKEFIEKYYPVEKKK